MRRGLGIDAHIVRQERSSLAKEEFVETRRTMTPAITLSNDPCPFCNFPPEKAVLVEIGRCEGMNRRTQYQVACACGAAGPLLSSPAEAGVAWRAARGRESPANKGLAWLAPSPGSAAPVESNRF